MRPFRIAVCISGQPRTWKNAKENILQYFNTKIFPERNTKIEIDYFIHTWDTNTYRDSLTPHWESKNYKIENPNEADEIKAAFSPKGMIYENFDETKFIEAWTSLFYSFMKSIYLKRQYEIENDIVYDMVIKTRFDVNFPPESILPNSNSLITNKFKAHFCSPLTLYASSLASIKKFPMEYNYNNMDDCFFYADSPTMDVVANLYRWFKEIKLRNYDLMMAGKYIEDGEYYYGPGTLLYKYATSYGILVTSLKDNYNYLYRNVAEQENLHSINDWRKVQELYFNWKHIN